MTPDEFAFARQVMAYWEFDDPAGSRARFAGAADREPCSARRATLLTQVARAQALEDEFDAAHATLDALGDPAGLADEPAVRALLERGRVHHLAGGPDDAVPLYRAAFDRADAAGLAGLAVDAAHMLAIVLPEAEEDWVRRGLGCADGSPDPLVPGMVAALLTNRAWSHVDDERWEQALELFDRVVDIRRESGDDTSLHTARWTRAWTLRALGRHGDALAELHHLAGTPAGAADPGVAAEIAENERALSRDPTTR